MNKLAKYRDLYYIEPVILENVIIAGKEHFRVTLNDGTSININVWEYGKMYEHPFLYDIIFGDILKLNAPVDLISYFTEIIDNKEPDKKFRVLELAAGSGLAGRELKISGKTELLVGIDILEQARTAALRDQPSIYDDYFVLNFESLSNHDMKLLSSYNFNCFFVTTGTGGADDDSGYKDVMLDSYKQAIKFLAPKSYIFFNIRQKHTTGQKLILEFLDTCCNIISKKVHPFRQLIDGTKVNAEFIILQLK